MITTVFDAVAADPANPVVVGAYDRHAAVTQVQAATASGTLTAGSLTVEASLDGTHFDPVSALAFTYGNMNNKLVKSTAYLYPYLRFTLANLAFTTTGTVTVTLAR